MLINNNMQPDKDLLHQYARTGSEVAFAELVRRHVNLVYSAALRQVGGDAHLARDVAQSVFTDLARKAASLCRRESLTGWLYTSAHFAASKLVRAERRRREREEKFISDPAHLPGTELDWETLRPILDSAMHGLQEIDREAVLLRYFENRPYAEVGAKLGLNENAARMRVERALEKLRSLLARRSITTTTGLATIISANAVQIAPPALAAALTKTSFAAAGTSFALSKLMTLSQFKVGLGAIVVAAMATTMVLQHQTQQKLRTENESLRQQISQLKAENDAFSNRLPSANDTQSLSREQLDELLRLRAQVGDLTRQLAEAARVNQQNAVTAASSVTNDAATVETQMLARRLSTAHNLSRAIYEFAESHQEKFPTNWEQIRDDFDTSERKGLRPGLPIPDTEADFNWATNEYEFVYQGSMTNLYHASNFDDIIVVRQKQPFLRMDGRLVKTYGFANAHGQLIAEPPEGFAAWENQRIISPPANQ